MKTLIEAAIARARATILLLVLIIAGGLVAFMTLPREANPDVTIPYIYIAVTLDGVSRRMRSACWCGPWSRSCARWRESRR